MCGGRGSRLDAETEKPLYVVGGRPMIDAVLEALSASRLETIHAVVSPDVPETRDRVEAIRSQPDSARSRIRPGRAWPDPKRDDVDVEIVDAPGEGYVADLQYALDRVETPVMTAVADLPLLDGGTIDAVLDVYEDTVDSHGSLTVCVPAALKRTLGTSLDTTMDANDRERELAPTGINVVSTDDADEIHVSWDVRFAVNVNYRSDARIAEKLIDGDTDRR